MKILLLLLLVGCNQNITVVKHVSINKFKVGDCVAKGEEPEAWEHDNRLIAKVIQVGKRKYQLTYYPNYTLSTEFASIDGYYYGITCPKESK